MAAMQRDDRTSSYPPAFRRSEFVGAAARSRAIAAVPSVDLPVLDFQDLRPAMLGEVCRDWGIFRLVNHGIPPSLIGHLHDEADRLLSLPFDIKKSRFSGSITYFWGTPAVTLRLPEINWIEGLNVPVADLISGDDDSSSSFSELAEEFGRQAARVAREIFETLAQDIGIASEDKHSFFSGAGDLLRFHRYPPSPSLAGGSRIGMDAHTDSSILTLVSEGEVGGLQILRDGSWLAVDPVPGSLLVNLGDMMQAISGDDYKSVKHRVAAGNVERTSVCFLAFPPEDLPIRSSGYREFTYREFKAKVQEDIRARGFKVGLDRFRHSSLDRESEREVS